MDTTILKRGIILLSLFLCLQGCKTQYAVTVDVGGVANKSLKTKIDRNSRKLLTEINHAFVHNTVPTFTGIEINDKAKSSIFALWETSPFHSQEVEISEDVLNLNREGMELRNIRLYVSKADSTGQNQEGVIVFTKTGVIDDFYYSIGTSRYNEIMAEGKDIEDYKCREAILSFIENIRTSYNRKDLGFLEKVFSDDVLLPHNEINRKVKESLEADTSREKLAYLKLIKSEYMTQMQQIFVTNDYIDIKFDDLKVVRHPKYPNYYGVTFKQKWYTTKYDDENYFFFLIDLSKEDAPTIVVSTIQPLFVNGREIDKSELFNIMSFTIQINQKDNI